MSSPTKKGKKAKVARAEPLDLAWELAELPSSQHRAGLAGLVMMVDHLQRRPFAGVCQVSRRDAYGATLRVDADGMQSLFDDLYAASNEETLVKQPWKDKSKNIKPPKRETEIEVEVVNARGKKTTKKERRYVYDVVVPSGAFLDLGASPGTSDPWLKLFRDFVWSILRGVPATRLPYQARADREPASDGRETFETLASALDRPVDLPSTYFLGAQACTADLVRFSDRERYRLLLHFWPYAARVYVPASLTVQGDREFQGFAIAVPDVSDLDEFTRAFSASLRHRSNDMSGYRPRDAIIDVPAEAGVDLIARVCIPLAETERRGPAADLVIGVDVFHCEKQGNNVRIRSVTRVKADPPKARAYIRVRQAYWSPRFRARRIENVLEGRPWWYGYAEVIARAPQAQTIGNDYFRRDVREAFKGYEVEMSDEQGKTIEELVYRTIGIYLSGRLKSRYGLEWSDVKTDQDKAMYNEKRGKLARDAFLAVRARTPADFVTYFTSTLCSVPQRLKEEQYAFLARELTSNAEKVRTLTLLALSAQG
ncbi:MAG: type I-MYXAN CRISPR-associated protein Cmx8 [Sandaracinaceae bacterium]|nr:type I-MYXAN CRISPR-associated protein Cmx8 [Sandaracinaceae bacterium]